MVNIKFRQLRNNFRRSHTEVFLRKGVLKTCSKFTGEHPCRSGITLRHGVLNALKIKFSVKDFFSKCDQICRKLRIWSHLLKKSLMENIFCAISPVNLLPFFRTPFPKNTSEWLLLQFFKAKIN